jgi:hypothetical protein
MDLGTISRRFGWYIAEVTGRLEVGCMLAVGDRRRRIAGGSLIKVDPLDGRGYSPFVFLPYSPVAELRGGAWEGGAPTGDLGGLRRVVSEALDREGGAIRLDAAELELEPSETPGIGLPAFWLERRGVELGGAVLLRDDYPGPRALPQSF